jgi:sugar transferase (PEP-CTERM/EpsH1 system associated)
MKRLLFIAHRVPYPPNKGERVRALEQIKALSPHFRLTIAAFAHSQEDYESADALRQWAAEVIVAPAGGWTGMVRGAAGLLAGRSVGEGVFRAKSLLDLLRVQTRQGPFDLAVASSSTTLPVALGIRATATVMDLVDVDSAKWARYAQSSRWPMRWVYRREARGIRRLEELALQRCAAVVVVSSAEAAALDCPGARVMVVGNGVDTEFFKPEACRGLQATIECGLETSPPGGPSIVFTGTMSYRPNVEGVCWFVREVWPELKRCRPGLRFVIVGRDPARAVRRLARVQGITVTGSVGDVRPYVAAASLAVAPLHIARGVQNKILEAMAMGRAVVASPEALAGLELVEGTEVLAARTPKEWQDCVLSLLVDEAARRRVEQAARARVVADYAWAAKLAPLVSLCKRLAQAENAGASEPTDRLGGADAGEC